MPESSNRPLQGMFNSLPSHYDLINHIITLGLDRGWRKAAARTCLEGQPQRVLDLGCGTGDLIITIARMAEGQPDLVGADYSQLMLAVARSKAERLGYKKITFIHGDAAELPMPSNYFDCVSISFAFRNLTYHNPLTQLALAETLRVLKPDGRFIIVESSQPESRLIRGAFHLYLRWFVEKAGYLISGNKRAYHYLAESAAGFFTPEEVRELLIGAGFREVNYRPLFFGVAGIHVAFKS